MYDSRATRVKRLQAGGGHRNTEDAIIRGLDWLQKMQSPDGSWGAKDKDAQGNAKSMDKNAATAMALLCYLGHCELQDSPKYGSTVDKAIQFLSSDKNPPAPKTVGQSGSYSHPIRTYALCEAHTIDSGRGCNVGKCPVSIASIELIRMGRFWCGA